MAKNILIVPGFNQLLPDRTPFMDFSNAISGTDILSVKVPIGVLVFSANTSPYISIYIDPANSTISGNTINVKDYFSVGGVQVINGTSSWVGPTTSIAGAQGAQGAQGNTGAQGAAGILVLKGRKVIQV